MKIFYGSLFFIIVAISVKEAPFFAALVNENNSEFYAYCGASIISDLWILTAAHCIDYSELGSKYIYAGGSNFINLTRNIHLVEKSFIHADWDNGVNDVALIKLRQPIQFNEYQQPISLRRRPTEYGNLVIVYRIGNQGNARNGAPVLNKAEVQYVNQSYCRSMYTVSDVPDGVFCTDSNEFDGCGGDSGSPVVVDGKLAGIIVAGANCIDIIRDNNDYPKPPGTSTHRLYYYN